MIIQRLNNKDDMFVLVFDSIISRNPGCTTTNIVVKYSYHRYDRPNVIGTYLWINLNTNKVNLYTCVDPKQV